MPNTNSRSPVEPTAKRAKSAKVSLLSLRSWRFSRFTIKLDQTPFDDYLRRIDLLLADLPRPRRAAIRRELLTHLVDAADDQGASPDDPAFQATVIDQLGPGQVVAAQFGQVHGGRYRMFQQLAYAAGLAGGGLGCLSALLAQGLMEDYGAAGLALICMFVVAGGVGLAGAWLRKQGHRVGWPLMLAGALILCGSGAAILHGRVAHTFDLLAGAGLLLSGELLLLNVAVHPAIAALQRRWKMLLFLAVAVLVSFVAPFSYLPNPLGAYFLLAGGYQYDPRLPFFNGFATLGPDPAPLVSTRLDQLIGQTGLDPLDPDHALVGYVLRGITTAVGGGRATVDVDLRYADGAVRHYAIPATQFGSRPPVDITGVDNLLAQHLALPDLPPVTATSPVQLGDPARLPLAAEVDRLVMVHTGKSQGSIQWAPDGRSFLIATNVDSSGAGLNLWQITLNGTPPRQLAEGVASYTPSPDGRSVVFLRLDSSRAPWSRYALIVVDSDNGAQRQLGMTDRAGIALAGDTAYFLDAGVLWRAPLAGGPPERLAALPDATRMLDDVAPLAISPDAQRVAYRCGSDLCLADVSGAHPTRIALGYAAPDQTVEDATPGPVPTAAPAGSGLEQPYLESLSIAWSHDGQRLAVAAMPTDSRGRPTLLILARDGSIARKLPIGPDGSSETPQWTPDDRYLFMTTYPAGGRRLVAVQIATGSVIDLSRPRWDAIGRLAPDGKRLLLWNGRGGFWTAAITVH